MRAILILVALGILSAYFLGRDAETIAGRARAVDGDSLFVEGAEIRLEDIDAPELAQTCEAGGRAYRCGEEAKRVLVEFVAGDDVVCRVSGRDRYNRRLARCRVRDMDLGARLVASGRAIAADGNYQDEQDAARKAKLGLWAGTFEAPAAWRRAHPRAAPRG